MNIVKVPHKSLRQQSQAVTTVSPQLQRFIKELEKTLEEKRKPRGVGLSAPQVNEQFAVFVTYLPTQDDPETPLMRSFINPQLVLHSDEKTFGESLDKPILEGCLSIPHFYGPVPRYRWVEFQYQQIKHDQLETYQERFDDFDARVMQHEYDHLHGKLFTDYTLEFELPLYSDEKGKLVEIDRTLAESF